MGKWLSFLAGIALTIGVVLDIILGYVGFTQTYQGSYTFQQGTTYWVGEWGWVAIMLLALSITWYGIAVVLWEADS